MDAYPYFQNSMPNSVEAGAGLFNDALAAVQSAVGTKDVWVTETGWPVSGETENLAIPSTQNAKAYWDAVGCPNFGKINMYWFTLQDAAPVTPNPSFGIVGSTLSDTPLYDLSCKGVTSLPATTAPTGTGSGAAVNTGASSSAPTGSGTTFSATSNLSTSNSLSNSSPTTSSLSSPSSGSGSGSGYGPGSGTGSGSGSGSGSLSNSGAARPSSSYYGVPGSPANSSTIGSSTGGATGGSGTGTAAGTSSGSAASPTSSTAAASAMFVSGPAVGVLAAAAAVVAVL